jgi:PAS domain S-box-containing protein/putative nucleotidyltransferase with HDIG domain
MVEQSLSGVYVSQDNKFVYANPRFCNIVGWSLEELLGKPTLDIVAADDDARRQVLDDRLLLQADASRASLSIRCRCKDGTEIDLGLHASKGMWEGGDAIVVMAQDITERMRAEKQIAAYIKQLEGTMEGTLQAVAKMVDMRDPYTAGHERRVGIIAADIAREMGWPEAKCQNLQLIGLVHDIGKIAVPAEILSKPTRLSKLEYQIIQNHAEQGYEILKDVEFPLPIAEIIREHHERMDGSGYPQGLQGDQILPEARILAVADVLESMASHRPYRPALGIDVAIKEIEEHREIWFESTVVDALLRLVREKDYKLPA